MNKKLTVAHSITLNEAKEFLRSRLNSIIRFRKDNGNIHKQYYLEVELILKYGMGFKRVIPLPVGVRKRKEQQCYQNVYQAICDNPGKYYYCEGYASIDGRFFCRHAWLINKNCEVIDPTWGDGKHYYGIIFKFPYVMNSMAKVGKFISMLENLYECGDNLFLIRKPAKKLLKYIELPKKLRQKNSVALRALRER